GRGPDDGAGGPAGRRRRCHPGPLRAAADAHLRAAPAVRAGDRHFPEAGLMDTTFTSSPPPPSTPPREGGGRAAARLRSLARGRAQDPAWARPALLAVLALTALLYLWGLDRNGNANSFYAAAVLA